jgi:hypothetical protein
MKDLRTIAGLCGALIYGAAWGSGCNDMSQPVRSPSSGVEIYFDLQAGPDNDPKRRLKVAVPFAGSATLTPSEQYVLGSTTHDRPVLGEPPLQQPYIWENQLDAPQYDTKALLDIEGWVYIYEANGRNGRRICRVENWAHRFEHLDHNEKRVLRDKPKSMTGPASGEASPVLAKLAENYQRDVVHHFLYNADGRIEKYIESRPVYLNGDATRNWTSKTVACYYYDKEGRPRRYVEPNNDLTGSSCDPIREGQGEFTDYFYDSASGAYRGARIVHSLNEHNRKEYSHRPIWDIRWSYAPDGRQEQIAALADSKKQLYYFTSDRELEGVPLPRPRSPKDISYAYYFYEPLPLSFIDGPGDPEKKVKQYHRERRRDFAGEVYISEYFAANGGLQHRIWWRGMDWAVFRHEQYDAQGKLKRAINRGLANEEHTYYAESDGYKSQLTQRPYLLHRVYEYDKAGKESLVAISWFNHDPEIDHPYRNPGRGGALIDLAKDAKRAWTDRNKPKPAVKEELKQFYGTPDGKVKWKDAESFGKAFGIFWEFKDMDRFVEAKRRAEGLPKGTRVDQ